MKTVPTHCRAPSFGAHRWDSSRISTDRRAAERQRPRVNRGSEFCSSFQRLEDVMGLEAAEMNCSGISVIGL
jgi:hypothetical protein